MSSEIEGIQRNIESIFGSVEALSERVRAVERQSGLPCGTKEGEARARSPYRYAFGSFTGQLYRRNGNVCETWGNHEWRLALNDFDGVVKYGEELTESEAVSRFGREILGDQQEDETPHERALRELDLKSGDRVRVERRVPSSDGGWNQVWVGRDKSPNHFNMDDAVGLIGVVHSTHGSKGVCLEIDETDERLLYPAHALTVVSRAGEDQSEDEKPDPPKTLADVEAYMLCEGRDATYYWHDYSGNVYQALEGMTRPIVYHTAGRHVHIVQVLGPVRLCTEDQAARVAELEQEVERLAEDRAEYSQALPDEPFPEYIAKAFLAIQHELPPSARRVAKTVATHYTLQSQGGEG